MSDASAGTPLSRRLGLREGQAVCYVNPPDGFAERLGERPDGVRVLSDLDGPLDLVVCFVSARRVLEQRLTALRRAVEPDGMLWVAWPERASGAETDVTEDVVREVALPAGLVDTGACSIGDTWSALRLVVCGERR